MESTITHLHAGTIDNRLSDSAASQCFDVPGSFAAALVEKDNNSNSDKEEPAGLAAR